MGISAQLWVGVLVLYGTVPGQAPGPPRAEAVSLSGRALTLGAALESLGVGIKADSDPVAKQVVLLGADRSVTPILIDDASRALFLDERLRGSRCEIQGRRFAGVPYVQVI